MRRLLHSAFLLATVFTVSLIQVNVNQTFAQGGYWSDVVVRAADELPTIQPATYRTVAIDLESIKQVLNAAPLESSRSNISAKNSNSIIELPMPDGTMESFSFVNSPVMAPELAAKYPEIQVYLGQGIDNPASIVRFDLTPQGFHAMILRSKSTVYIDPYTTGDLTKCISYTKASFYEATDKQHEGCIVEDEGLSYLAPKKGKNSTSTPEAPGSKGQVLQMGMQKNLMTSNGTILRTYRLALACTGEYAAYHGGTDVGVMSAMNTSMARVNGVFERDVCIRMVLVPNNNNLIFFNSGSDPYSNGNGSAMLAQNQTTCDDVIGYNNYDIGHVFSTGGGGVAYLQAPCGGNKAGGVTGQTAPVNDPFDIDYVSHEMGHQWGANHTQNNSCNRSSGAAFEPGSASTIMGYAGICSPNLQPNSDDHFHNHSINEMISFTVNGGGNSCSIPFDTNNNIPTVVAHGGGSTIPANTPFELIATGNDSDGDPITYNWEEYDLGPSTAGGDNNLTNPSGNQPIFRSWSSTTSATRVFPRITDLVNGTTTIGEHMPTYSRGLQFKCSVRDNRAGGGAFTDDLISISVDGNSGPFVVTSPNSGSIPNGFATITWDVAGTDAAPVNCTTVEILLSTDGGYSFPTQLASGVTNDGSAVVLIPDITTTTARFKIKGEGNVFFDISNSNVIITQGVGGSDWDIALQGVSGLTSTDCGTAVSPVITVVNLGVQTITEFTTTYTIGGGGASTQTWVGSLTSGMSVDIAVCPNGDQCIDLGPGTHVINANVSLGMGSGPDDNLSNNVSNNSFTVSGGSDVTLTLLTDSYPGETTWSVTDANGLVIWSGGPYFSSETVYTEAACISYGCYTLSVFDSYGDGMSYGGVTGDYQLVDAEGNVLAQIVDGGAFGTQADHPFCIESPVIEGCTDPNATNYDPNATVDDGTCYNATPGCTDSNACNYDVLANTDDGSCTYPPGPFLDCAGMCLFDADGDGVCDENEIPGCQDPTACNYDALATDPGICVFTLPGYNCEGVALCPLDLNNNGAIEVGDLLIILADFGCTNACNGDVNGDGVVTVSDILNILSSFGEFCQ
ncbi:MAG TPA: hypothetical protein EYN19_03820 [Flavobacteriales bacterium]|nr:hypothetical protein [Flavobacteriales bacterium]